MSGVSAANRQTGKQERGGEPIKIARMYHFKSFFTWNIRTWSCPTCPVKTDELLAHLLPWNAEAMHASII